MRWQLSGGTGAKRIMLLAIFVGSLLVAVVWSALLFREKPTTDDTDEKVRVRLATAKAQAEEAASIYGLKAIATANPSMERREHFRPYDNVQVIVTALDSMGDTALYLVNFKSWHQNPPEDLTLTGIIDLRSGVALIEPKAGH